MTSEDQAAVCERLGKKVATLREAFGYTQEELGAHIHGGFECGTNPTDYPDTKGCECVKFKPERKKR